MPEIARVMLQDEAERLEHLLQNGPPAGMFSGVVELGRRAVMDKARDRLVVLKKALADGVFPPADKVIRKTRKKKP